ncbi:amidase family protein [Paenibacillus sp. Soil522]|uniref:amidase family protein n=1 Tax=Paenibacillus sp. Soil522 TaxID=1736388 RepID=UPI0006FFFB78|nr:amidase family protein [Paenibacillus sp. Soil522]KRE35203.1 amidase [Paenibacillus sp. Soil522]
MGMEIVEATISSIQAALESGGLTSHELVLFYFDRIANHDKDGLTINSVLALNPDALFMAAALDSERAVQGPRGPLHGIPILLKDNINTGDHMPTSAGSLALANSYAGEDAFIVKKLREAGAVILGKANMTEFANFMTEGMPSGYSSRGGQVLNPYNISTPTGGSSAGSGVAVACNFCMVSIGTETSGSILNPGNLSSTVGIKPTVGLVSRSGILPLSNSQDTAGPMARTVTDATLVLNAIAAHDSSDAAMGAGYWRKQKDYSVFLDPKGLEGARIGIPRDYFFEELTDEQLAIFNGAVELMRKHGAVIVDPADVRTARQIVYSSVVLNEFKSSLNAYLAKLPSGAKIRTLTDIIAFNNEHPIETLKYGQSTLLLAETTTSGTHTEIPYLRNRAADLKLCKDEGIDATMEEHQLDALLFPADFGARITSRAGYPSIVVPAGYTAKGVPFGVTFAARAYEEPMLIKLAYSYEQHSRVRRPPSLKSFI